MHGLITMSWRDAVIFLDGGGESLLWEICIRWRYIVKLVTYHLHMIMRKGLLQMDLSFS